jgi:nitroimidazol reductase NimA-like FMN-containing flavoprotein (pyridoxamine 5'-phosphate oxidase superfamily)
MTNNNDQPIPSFTEIPPVRCAELLATHSVGRVAWNTPDGPQILPVSYAVHDKNIVFRTSPYGVLSQLIQRSPVAFEIDQLDPETHTGWSIQVQGQAEAVQEPAELVHLWTLDDPRPWAPGIRNVFISITARIISGRAISA